MVRMPLRGSEGQEFVLVPVLRGSEGQEFVLVPVLIFLS